MSEIMFREITRELLDACQIPKEEVSVTQTFENGDEFYEDKNYVCWNGM